MKKNIIINTIIVLFLFSCAILGVSFITKTPYFEVIDLITNNLYFPHTNYFAIGLIKTIPFLEFFYIFSSLAIGISLIWHKTFSEKTQNYYTVALQVSFCLYLLFTFLQTINLSNYFAFSKNYFKNKTTEEKYKKLYPDIYNFAETCKKKLPKAPNVEFHTDMNILEDPGLIDQRKLAYFLYPIDIRQTNDSPSCSMIIYNITDKITQTPLDYTILVNQNNLKLLAVKNNIK